MRFTVIGVNFTLVAECRPRVLVFDPLSTWSTLRALDLHRHLQAFSPGFADAVRVWELTACQPNARQFPQLLSVAALSIGEPAHTLTCSGPVPHLTDDSLEQTRVSLATGTGDPVAAASLQEQCRSARTLVCRSILLHLRVQLIAFQRDCLLCTGSRRPVRRASG